MLDRWQECDRETDVLKRLDCRSSRMNDSMHWLERRVKTVEHRVNAGLALQIFAGLGGIATVASTVHSLVR